MNTPRERDSAWIWSEEHGDYYKAVYGPDGTILRYVWGRATIPPEPAGRLPQSSAPSHTAQSPRVSNPAPTTGAHPYATRPSGTPVGTQVPPTSQPYSDQQRDQYGRIIQPVHTHSDPPRDQYGRIIPTPQAQGYAHPTPSAQPTQYSQTQQPPQSTSPYTPGQYSTTGTGQYPAHGHYPSSRQYPPYDPNS
ncbi:hypothetical protein P171DRAFT_515304 [Karstenula rhodostoma CBS 690.94]|uniref:Uncharacterized protein n=1 Tax=Karstenula rhodostoma CBS 690.94 TaxID=1392251 RepID=A0A9P4UJ31_9PLEO|nr:hypothetical protein P171DRAFT_515304 [Karstenula rhodostoma CBS 690.94]